MLNALRTLNACEPPEALFAELRDTGLDHAVGPELRNATAFITELDWRFFHAASAAQAPEPLSTGRR